MSASRIAVPPNIVALYGQALFKNKNDSKTNDQQLKALQGSGFNTVLLFALHVTETGELYYSDLPFVQNGKISDQTNPQLPKLVAGLRQGGVNQVLITIGSAAADDYLHIQALLAKAGGAEILLQNFEAVASFLDIDGFDLDDEEVNITSDTIATLVKMLYPLGRKSIVTAAPYNCMGFWLECLQKVFKQNEEQLFTWWNLQTYGGADANDWIAAIARCIEEGKVGIKDANAFVVPGYCAYDSCLVGNLSPQEVCEAISQLTVGGGYLWNAAGVFASDTPPKGWADAIINGLNKRC